MNMKIVGYAIGKERIIYVNGKQECSSYPPYLDFLTMQKPDTIRVIYDVTENTMNLMSLLKVSKDSQRELINTTKLTFCQYKFRYVYDKFFSIKGLGKFAYYCDTKQYLIPWNLTCSNNEDILLEYAKLAKEIGECVYSILQEFGCEPTSLINPFHAYEECEFAKVTPKEKQVEFLEKQRKQSKIKEIVIDKILEEIHRR